MSKLGFYGIEDMAYIWQVPDFSLDMDYAYANIVGLESDNTVVHSFETHPLFRFIKFYHTFEEAGIDTDLPTLYVGYKESKSRFSINVLKAEITPISWWCASPSEDPMRFLKGFQGFITTIAQALVQDLEAERTDPIFGSARSSRELFTLLNERQLLVTYCRKGTLYIYSNLGNVLVIDTRLYQPFGIDSQKLKSWLKSKSLYFYDDENNSIFHFFTNRFEYDGSEVGLYIPYLIWLKAKNKHFSEKLLKSTELTTS